MPLALRLGESHRVLVLAVHQAVAGDGTTRGEMLGLWPAAAIAERLQASLEGHAIEPPPEDFRRSNLIWKPQG